jgi:hypothetical protein
MRLEEIGMLAGLGRPNAQGSRAYGLQRIIPLEELTTGTRILDMRALPQIKLVMKFPCACRAAHVVIPLCCCIPLLAHCRLIIRNSSSKRLQNIFVICLDIGMRSPYTLSAPNGRPSGLGGLTPHQPRSLLSRVGALFCLLLACFTVRDAQCHASHTTLSLLIHITTGIFIRLFRGIPRTCRLCKDHQDQHNNLYPLTDHTPFLSCVQEMIAPYYTV